MERWDSRFTELAKDILLYGLMAGVSQLSGVLLLPLFTRAFSAAEYGSIEIVVTLTTLLSTFTTVALPSALQRYFKEIPRESLAMTAFGFMAALGGCLVLLGAATSSHASALLLGDSELGELVILGLVAAYFHALSTVPAVILRMKRQIFRFNALNLVHAFSYAILAIYFVFEWQFGVIGVVGASACAALIRVLLGLWYIRDLLGRSFSVPVLRRLLRYSLPLFPTPVVSWLNNQIDRIVLLTFVGLQGVGLFGAGARIGSAVVLLAAIFQRSWAPHAYGIIDSPAEERDSFYRTMLDWYAAVFACVGLALVTIAPELFRLLMPGEYFGGLIILPWYMGAKILHSSWAITAMGSFAAERTYAGSVAAWTGVVLNVTLGVTLVPRFGIGGAAIGRFAAELFFTGFLCFFSSRHSSVRFSAKPLLGVVGVYVVASLLVLWLGFNFAGTRSLIARLIVGAGAAWLVLRIIRLPVGAGLQALRKLVPGTQAQ